MSAAGPARSGFIRFAVVLGVLSAVGPVAIDMYLPALPDITHDLRTDANHVGLTLMGFFLGLTIGQPVYGPLSDRFGRRAPLAAGLAIYVVGSLVCAVSPGIGLLVVGRVLEGLGAGASLVISAAIVRDLHTGREAVRLMAARTLVIGVSPILAPVIGAAIIAAAPWRGIFVAATLFGMLAVGLTAFIPETHTPERRSRTGLVQIVKAYGRLLGHRQFRNVVLTASFVQTALIGYIAGSPFLLQTIDRLSPVQYGVVFACNALGFIGAAQATPLLMHWVRPATLIRAVVFAQSLVGLLILAEAWLGQVSLPFILPALLAFQACTGFVGAPATVIALHEHGAAAGTASALMMCAMIGFGAIGSALVAAFANGTAMPMAAVILGGSVCAALAATRIRSEPLPAASRPQIGDELLH